MIISDSFTTSLLDTESFQYTVILPPNFSSCLFWLHGYRERSAHILASSHLEALAYQYQIAVILPDLPDTYYFNQPWNHCYTEQCFIYESIPYIRQNYPLPDTPNHTFIAGASMGGFGSLLLGSRYSDIFGKIATISGAFIIDDLLIGNPEVTGGSHNFSHFQNLFGDIPSLDTCTARNPLNTAALALHQKKMPPVFMTCGTNDMLYPRNICLREHLLALGTDLSWLNAQGAHDWKCFDSILESVFSWLTS